MSNTVAHCLTNTGRAYASVGIWLHISCSFQFGCIGIRRPRLALWFSRTLTDDGELSASTMFGGTAIRERERVGESEMLTPPSPLPFHCAIIIEL